MRPGRSLSFCLVVCWAWTLAASASLAETLPPAGPPASPPSAAPQDSAPAKPAEPAYVYQGEKFRDPFLPLAGQGMQEMAPVSSEEVEFNPGAVELKGILSGKSGRVALLRGAGNTAYIVRNGKIWDSKRNSVKGFVGILKEKTLVMIGPNNQVTELKLKSESDKDKKEAAR